ncbi:hypothetical protein ACB098_12G004300 [Castanea mollissima]
MMMMTKWNWFQKLKRPKKIPQRSPETKSETKQLKVDTEQMMKAKGQILERQKDCILGVWFVHSCTEIGAYSTRKGQFIFQTFRDEDLRYQGWRGNQCQITGTAGLGQFSQN